MIKNYLKVALRKLIRDKWFSVVNIGGLTIGLTVTILLSLYVKFELSFDKFHPEHETINRLHNIFSREGLEEEKLPCTLYETGTAIQQNIPEIEELVRIFFWGTGEVSINNEVKNGSSIIYTDSSFFKLFNFPIINGDAVNPLLEPNKIVVTQKVANEWFGDVNPIGKSIQINTYDYDTIQRRLFKRPQTLTVSAVMANIPNNSHLKFDVVTSFATMPEVFLRGQGQDFFTYIKLYNPISEDVAERISEINATEIEKGIGESRPRELTKTQFMTLIDLHLNANFKSDRIVTSSKSFVLTLGVVAFLVLIIATINFVNLTTARADNRMREVGVRKAVGSSQKQIIFQFIGESILVSTIALLISFMLAELLITPFNNLLNTNLELNFFQNLKFTALLLIVSFIVGIVGGIYPSLYISRLKPSTIMKGVTEGGQRNTFIKSLLVVFQFSMASLLIFGLIVINSQIRFFKSKDLGFNKKNVVLFFGITEELNQKYQPISEELKTIPNVISVSAAQSFPSSGLSGMNLKLEGSEETSAFSIRENRVQDYYIETLGMEIVNGRDFIPNSPADDDGFIINETAARMLGLNNPIGARVVMWHRPGRIIGVVKDYHFASLREDIGPLIITRYNPRIQNITLRINENNREETLRRISDVLKKHDPNYRSSFSFLEDYINLQYRAEERTYKLILSSSVLALVLSMVGLYALSAYAISRRTKELGIRKILGASISLLARLLLTDTAKWVLLANAIALPVGWYAAKSWLRDFAYRIKIEPWIFATALLLTFLISFLTIAWQIFKAARANPVEALRYE